MSHNGTRQNPILKIIILGNSCVGKTTILNMHDKKRVCDKYKATLVSDIFTKDVIFDGRPVTAHYWDTAGSDRFKNLSVSSCRGAHCCILAYDVTDNNSFESLDNWRDEFLLQSSFQDPENFPFVLLGNKVDKESLRTVSSADAQQWCKTRGDITYFEVSGKDDTNVDEAFQTIARAAWDRYLKTTDDLPDDNDVIYLKDTWSNYYYYKDNYCWC